MISVNELVSLCQKEDAAGFTIHGGEPLDQSDGLKELLVLSKEKGKTVILFTGYIKKELNSSQKYVWNHSDIVVAGRYKQEKRNLNLQFRVSTNQRVYCHKGPYENYKINDGYTTAIITIDENGQMDVNGFLSDDVAKLIGD